MSLSEGSDKRMEFDIIGDIHGYADALLSLLKKLGYQSKNGVWGHPEKKAVFLGDFIDRGPDQIRTVNIVRSMVEAGNAKAVMGNHEFNAIAWSLPIAGKSGAYLREHNSTHLKQHQAFLDEIAGDQDLYKEIIDWFSTLPLWLDFPGFRAVHACWHSDFINKLSPDMSSGNSLSYEFMVSAVDNREKETLNFTKYKAIEAILKGIECPLPKGEGFKDKDGHLRFHVRTKWWDPQAKDYHSAFLLPPEDIKNLPNNPLPSHILINTDQQKPVFFGHYWLTGDPQVEFTKSLCLDYSIANGGKLAAYRWAGENKLKNENLVWVE